MILTILVWATLLIGLYTSIFWMVMFFSNFGNFRGEFAKARTLKRFPLVSVIIPAYNVETTVVPCLESVLALDYPQDKLEIVVVDDGSTDATFSVLERFLAKRKNRTVVVIRQPNGGKAHALNQALASIKGEFFACLDADSFIDSPSLKKMLYVFETEGRDMAIVTPAMKIYRPKSLLEKLQNFEYLVAILINRINSTLNAVYVAPGPFSLYRTDLIRDNGGFDETNIAEDMEIAYRMQKLHYRIRQCPDGYVYTESPKNIRQLYYQRKRWYKGGFLNLLKYRSILFNKEYGHFGMYQIPLTLIGFLFAFLALFFFGYFTLYPLANNIYNFYLINFDIGPYFRNFVFEFDILALNLFQLAVVLGSFALGVFLLIASHSNAREKINLLSILYMPPYFLFYYIAIGFFCVLAILDVFLGGNKHRW